MLELEPAHGPDELGQPLGRRLVGQRILPGGQHTLQHLVDHRLDEQFLGREPAVEGAHPDPGPLGDGLHAHVDPFLVEGGAGRGQDLDPVPGRIAA